MPWAKWFLAFQAISTQVFHYLRKLYIIKINSWTKFVVIIHIRFQKKNNYGAFVSYSDGGRW